MCLHAKVAIAPVEPCEVQPKFVCPASGSSLGLLAVLPLNRSLQPTLLLRCLLICPTARPRGVFGLEPTRARPAFAQEFLIVRFLEPILVLAKEKSPGKYVLIDEEEEQVLRLVLMGFYLSGQEHKVRFLASWARRPPPPPAPPASLTPRLQRTESCTEYNIAQHAAAVRSEPYLLYFLLSGLCWKQRKNIAPVLRAAGTTAVLFSLFLPTV